MFSEITGEKSEQSKIILCHDRHHVQESKSRDAGIHVQLHQAGSQCQFLKVPHFISELEP